MRIGCGVIILTLLLSGCYQDHSRTLVMSVEEGGTLEIESIEVLLEKSGTESSDSKMDGELSLKTTAL